MLPRNYILTLGQQINLIQKKILIMNRFFRNRQRERERVLGSSDGTSWFTGRKSKSLVIPLFHVRHYFFYVWIYFDWPRSSLLRFLTKDRKLFFIFAWCEVLTSIPRMRQHELPKLIILTFSNCYISPDADPVSSCYPFCAYLSSYNREPITGCIFS